MRVCHAAVLAALLFAGFGWERNRLPGWSRPEAMSAATDGPWIWICRSPLDQPEFTANGIKCDTHRLEQNGLRTVDLLANYNSQTGSCLQPFNSQLDMSTHRDSSGQQRGLSRDRT
jgi:hypothetical protein